MLTKYTQAYLPEAEFPVRIIDKERCKKCGRCIETCPTSGYKTTSEGFPEPIGFGGFEQACLNCGNCISVCTADAITMEGCYSVKKGRYRNQLLNKMSYPHPLPVNGKKSFDDIESELTDVEKTIYKRRSVRLFKNKAVPKETIERILEAGRFAPSAGNCQPYKFIVMRDQKKIRKLERLSMFQLKILKNTYMVKNGKKPLWKNSIFSMASLMMINKLDPRPITAMEKADKKQNKLFFNSPAIIFILKDVRGVSNPDLDAGICAQNMVLAAHSLGIGTCYISLPMVPLSSILMAPFRNEIGIKYPFKAVTSIALGYPAGKIDNIVKRDTPPVEWL